MNSLIELLKSSQIELIAAIIGVTASLVAFLLKMRLNKKDEELKITVVDSNNNKINQRIKSNEDVKEWIELGSKQIEELGKVGSNDNWEIDHTRNKKIKILLLTSSPMNMERLQVDREIRIITNELKSSFAKDKIIIHSGLAVTPSDFARLLIEEKPSIVHFSGHGTRDGIVLQNEEGKAQVLSWENLIRIFKQTKNVVECLILNTVYSGTHANELAKEIPIVIGMEKAITDKAAISFSEGFYKAIGGGKNYEEAFKFAKLLMDLENGDIESKPILSKRINLPPTKHSR
jgi:hypothetical protein